MSGEEDLTMCGLLGGLNTQFNEASLARLRHRGPDQQSLLFVEVPGHGVAAFGQTRLNIVDHRNIDLPVRIGESAIVLNGEVYNYLELRSELRTFGWEFQTNTDSEVALAAYLQWGPDCLGKFNGMFALAIWDGQRFFCARDRMGKKPFFYRCDERSFEFASEVKAFSDLEFVSCELFDLFEFCFNEHTLYRNVRALPPGHCLTYDPRRGTCRVSSYWDIERQVSRRIGDEKQAVDTFIGLLEDAVRLRLRCDVPVTLFLAGGLDSSLIAKLSGVEESFTCQFDEFRETVNEESYVSDLTGRLGIRANFVRPTRKEFLRDLPKLAYHLEMPTGSFSVFPLYRLAEAARGAGYKVVLSGEGSDELFAGYVRNEFLLSDASGSADAKRNHYASMLERYQGSDFDRFCRMASRNGLSGAAMMKMFLTHYWDPHRTTLDNVCYVESRVFLQPLLQMADRMCMAHGVENRCPFLDHRLVEFAFSLDDSLRVRDGQGKWIVHRAAQKLLPPGSAVLTRAIKDGLPTPINQWMHGIRSFDRRHWNALMTAECIKALLGFGSTGQGEAMQPRSMKVDEVLPAQRRRPLASAYSVRRAPE